MNKEIKIIKQNSKPVINCAIYTRKSCEEGLEQEFNSLDAQFEAGKAYITSQKSEGWRVYKRYDDGGYSGGNIERPGLKQLMQDIENGYINCVVVYKVDRLSRSLSDFFKLMETFDRKGISFVSVTQSFNTTNSMGKLTLNILLSFAQFEREVTGERIRDKISASKKKGMWMGGIVPLGYDAIERKLIPNVEEMKTIKYIFESYLEVKSIDILKQKLNSEGIKTKQWQAKSGKTYGKTKWTNSMLGRVLRNQIYVGKVHHNGNIYEGEHEGIVESVLFNEVQELLNNQNRRNNDSLEVGKYLLFQKLYNEQGEMFKCDACVKTNKSKAKTAKVRYNYYITTDKRLKCEKVDKTVIELTRQFVSSKHEVLTPAENDELSKIDWNALTNQQQKYLVKHLISRVIYKDEEIKLEMKREAILNLKERQSDKINHSSESFNHQIYISSDEQTINIIADTKTTRIIPTRVNKTLLKAITTGYKYKKLLESGATITQISKQENKQDTYIGRMTKLGYLSPRIIESIFEAKHNESLTVIALEKIADANIDWSKQEIAFAEYR
jgi:site-specific DNA recombinase